MKNIGLASALAAALGFSLFTMYGFRSADTSLDVQEEPTGIHAPESLRHVLASQPGVGETAPNIVGNSPDGKKISLKDLKGDYVLIDFWASWCGPCRRENPYVVKAYEKYHDKDFGGGAGFEVFSVSLDQLDDRWKQAIQKDRLSWDNHVSDLKGWHSEHAKLYGVNSIPMSFLVDKDGKIIAKGLRGEALESKLESLVKD